MINIRRLGIQTIQQTNEQVIKSSKKQINSNQQKRSLDICGWNCSVLLPSQFQDIQKLEDAQSERTRQEDDHLDVGAVIARPTRLNADNSNKKALFLFWLIFAIFEITILITSNFTPYAFIFKTNESELSGTKYKECNNPSEFDNGLLTCQHFSQSNPRVGLIMRNLSPMNQFAQINLLFIPRNTSATTLTVEQEFKVELMSLQRKQMTLNQNQKATVFQKGEDVKTIDKFGFDSTEYQLQEIKWSQDTTKEGYEVKLGYYREFKSDDALLIITFLNISQEYINSYDIEPQAILMNKTYTIFIIVLRAVFLGVIAFTFAVYLHKLRQIVPCLQQKVVFILSGFSILFNDPYYFIEVFKPNIFCLFLSTTFVCTFFIALAISWVCMLQKIIASIEDKEFEFTKYRIIKYSLIAGSYYIIIFSFIFEISYYSFSESPIIPLHSTFNLLYVAVIVLFALLFLYIAWLYLTIARDWKNLVWRDKIYSTFNIFFILLNLIFILLGWFSFYDESSQKFQIFYASMNFYVIYLQYMYSTPLSLKDERQKDHEQLNQMSQNEVTSYMEEGCITIDLQEKQKQMRPELQEAIDQY